MTRFGHLQGMTQPRTPAALLRESCSPQHSTAAAQCNASQYHIVLRIVAFFGLSVGGMGGGHKARGHTNGPSHTDSKQSRQQRGRGSRQHAGGETRDGLPPPVPLGEAVDAATSFVLPTMCMRVRVCCRCCVIHLLAVCRRTNHLLAHLRTHHNAVAARGVVMPTGLCIYLAYSLIACNLGAYGFVRFRTCVVPRVAFCDLCAVRPQNFHYYNFPAIMWNCLKLSRPLLMIIVMHSRSDLASAIRSPAVVFKVAIVASIGLLYLWFTFLLSTSLWRLACIALPYVSLWLALLALCMHA